VSLALLAVLSVLVGAVFGLRAALCFALFMVLQTLVTTFHAQRLWRLLDVPVYGEVPSAPGIRGEIYYRLHKLAKRRHAQVRQIEQQHSRFIQGAQCLEGMS
jgi:two-component system phosphate regulon sensor histidine kinase PhoR